MKVASLEILHAIRERVVVDLRGKDPDAARVFWDSLAFEDYHGFDKAYLPEPYLSDLLLEFGYTPSEVQVEIVKVTRDLRGEVHHHEEATASIVILGPEEHLVWGACHGYVYQAGKWVSAQSGDRFDFLVGEDHGVTIIPFGGYGSAMENVCFLSTQSPPITGKEGRNDYHKK